MKNILLLLAFASLPAMTQNVLNGKVIDVSTSKAIPFAKIYFPDLEVGLMTDTLGIFVFEQAPSGSFRIRVSATGYESQMLNYSIDEGESLKIALKPKHIMLDKVIISNVDGSLQSESITNVESVDLSEINEIPSATIGEAMTNIPGVYQVTTGTGISKPVVRGLSGSRVVTYLNGLRIENQQWGADHGMGITDMGIGRVEIIKGPSSLLYGADAMGGVVYFSDEPYAAPGAFEGYVKTRFDENTTGTTNRLGLKLNKKGLKLNIFGGYSNHADYRLPNRKYTGNSRWFENQAKVSLGYNKKNWVMNLRYNFLNQRIGLPGHTHDSIIDPTSFHWDDQSRSVGAPAQLIFNHYISLENKFFFKKSQLSLLVGNTNNRLREFEEKITISEIDMQLNNTVWNLKWKRNLNDKIDIVAGSQGMYRINSNDPGAFELLLPDGTTFDVGVYAMISGRISKWRYQAGGRFDNRILKAKQTKGEFQDFKRSYNSMNYSAGIARLGDHLSFRLNVSSGFRAPTISELLSDGVHHGSNRYEIGNPDLDRELALQIDMSLGLHYEHIEFIVNPFFNLIRDYIYLEPQDSVASGFNVYNYQQTNLAYLGGTDVGFHYHPHFAHWLHIELSYSYLYAEDDQGSPLPLIPQSRINNRLKIEFPMKTKFRIENFVVQYLYHFEQQRVAQFETPTPGYHLLNIGVNMKWELKTPLTISTGVRNVLNEAYYNHLSRLKNIGLAAPGINYYLSLKLNFNVKHN